MIGSHRVQRRCERERRKEKEKKVEREKRRKWTKIFCVSEGDGGSHHRGKRRRE